MRFFRLLAVTLLFVPQMLWASGMTLHLWMADRAVEQIRIPELKSLLENHRAAYRNGSVFPDSGYAVDHPYGEYAHWHGFLNAYFSVIQDRCPDLSTESCRDTLSHMLGSLAHTIGDINFDRHFVTTAAQIDYNGNIETSQGWLDTGLDFLAIFEHKRAFKIPQYRLPVEMILEAFLRGGEVQASGQDLHKGAHIIRLGLVGEPLAAPFTYFHYKNNMPWASKNYLQARGGVEDTARRIALAWELVWTAFQSGGSQPDLFQTVGGWPYADFYIDGLLMEEF